MEIQQLETVYLTKEATFKNHLGTSPAIQCLRLHGFSQRVQVSSHVRTKVPHATPCSQKKKKLTSHFAPLGLVHFPCRVGGGTNSPQRFLEALNKSLRLISGVRPKKEVFPSCCHDYSGDSKGMWGGRQPSLEFLERHYQVGASPKDHIGIARNQAVCWCALSTKESPQQFCWFISSFRKIIEPLDSTASPQFTWFAFLWGDMCAPNGWSKDWTLILLKMNLTQKMDNYATDWFCFVFIPLFSLFHLFLLEWPRLIFLLVMPKIFIYWNQLGKS